MDMTEIKPALTGEEWAELERAPGPDTVAGYAFSKGPHGCAAWMLHGESFGFTREDVCTVRWFLEHGEARGWHGDWLRAFESLAARIEALLPPEE